MNYIFTTRGAFMIVISSLLFSGLITSIILLFFDPKQETLFPLALLIGETLLVIPLFLLLFKSKKSILKSIRLNSISKFDITNSIMLSIGIVFFSDEIDRLIGIIIPPPNILNNINSSLSINNPLALILIFISAVPIASFAEEVLFRGYLQQILEKQWGNITKAVLMSSLFFALIHLIPYWLIQIYLLGIIMGYLSWKTNSIIPSMILHAINNTMAFLTANWENSFNGWYNINGHVSPLILVIGLILIYLGFKNLNKSFNIT